MRYEQLTPVEAMIEYCEWLIAQQTETSVGKFFKIIEEGNHQTLIDKGGKYYQLYTGTFEME